MATICATTTATPARVMMFQASQKPRYLDDVKFETPWGECTVKGRLGQRHADFVESLMYCAEDRADIDDGTIRLLVDPYKVRTTMSQQYSHQQLKILAEEVMTALIVLDAGDICTTGHIVDEIEETRMTRDIPDGTGRKRHLWNVKLGRVFCKLLQNDIKLYYEPKPIAMLSSGVSQAIVRHILTHKNEPNGGWKLDDMIRRVCGDVDSTKMRNARRSVKDDACLFQSCGISFDGETFTKN